jgi:heptosyltransferase-2
MSGPRRILLIHTAFIGDVILALPVLETIRRLEPASFLAFLVIPETAPLLQNHPAVDEIFVYDKRRRGFRELGPLVRRLRDRQFDVALVPHRSLRSAAIARGAQIPARIGFSTSAGKFWLTSTVPYNPAAHEIARDLELLRPLGMTAAGVLPRLYPDSDDVDAVNALLGFPPQDSSARAPMIALAPGSVWATKRWPAEAYAELARELIRESCVPVLVGGEADRDLCTSIASSAPGNTVVNAAGRLTLLQSAELIRRCVLTVSNDSAPMHLAVAMRTPVVALFGATVPRYGFAPQGTQDVVIETPGLSCRPCSIHGGHRCPIRTFDCMVRITPDQVLSSIRRILHGAHSRR